MANSNRIIIGLGGHAGSGKDTIGNQLVKILNGQRFAFADELKNTAYDINPLIDIKIKHRYYILYKKEPVYLRNIVDQLGWDEAKKHPEVRRFLQRFGTEGCREHFGYNIWTNTLWNNVEKLDINQPIIITDSRFDNEIQSIKKHHGHLIWLKRNGIGPVNSHVSDNNTEYLFDYIVENNSTPDNVAKEIIQLLKLEK